MSPDTSVTTSSTNCSTKGTSIAGSNRSAGRILHVGKHPGLLRNRKSEISKNSEILTEIPQVIRWALRFLFRQTTSRRAPYFLAGVYSPRQLAVVMLPHEFRSGIEWIVLLPQ
jgi:hypothetical protein